MGLALNEAIVEGVLNGTFDGVKTKAGALGQIDYLKAGSPAPKLCPGKWIKGEPVVGFEEGTAYLIDFWASWCGPCVESIPKLNEIHRKYKDKGLMVIGQNVSENLGQSISGNESAFSRITDKMDYRVALDDIAKSKTGMGSMAENWLIPSGLESLPTAFLIGKDGRIVWFGVPTSLSDTMIDNILTPAATTDNTTVYQ